MSSILTRELQNGYLEKLERDRVCEVIKRSEILHYGYVSAKKALNKIDVEYHSNGMAHIYCDKNFLYSMARLRSFKKTGWTYYKHFSGRIGLYITDVIGDRCYIEININHSTST
ncbi:hypothetical protein [Erwinia tasmaniensis]|uniref:hypothetical protein n=1 Tax=Erwinia tasmaniensis TaxID=338565 RepID=UPI003A4DF8C8